MEYEIDSNILWKLRLECTDSTISDFRKHSAFLGDPALCPAILCIVTVNENSPRPGRPDDNGLASATVLTRTVAACDAGTRKEDSLADLAGIL
jgi:hypothetical protein